MERESVSSHIDYVTLQQNFHLPISQVAKDLGVCATVLKKLCRQHGIPRWPHRKIKSLNKMIAVLEETKTESEEEEQQRLIELKALMKKKADIMENPSIIGPTYSHISPRSSNNKPISIINKFHNASPTTSHHQINEIKLTPPQSRLGMQMHQPLHQQPTMQPPAPLNLTAGLQQHNHTMMQAPQQQQMKLAYANRAPILYTSHSALQSSTSPSRTSPDFLRNDSHFGIFTPDRRFSSPLVSEASTRPASAPIPPSSIHPTAIHSNIDQNNFVKPKFQNYHDNFEYNGLKFTPTRSSAPASILSNHSSAFSQINQSPISQTLIAPVYSSSEELSWSAPAPPPSNNIQPSESNLLSSSSLPMHMNHSMTHSLHQLLSNQPLSNLLIDQDNKNPPLYHSRLPVVDQDASNILSSAEPPLPFELDSLKCDISESLARS